MSEYKQQLKETVEQTDVGSAPSAMQFSPYVSYTSEIWGERKLLFSDKRLQQGSVLDRCATPEEQRVSTEGFFEEGNDEIASDARETDLVRRGSDSDGIFDYDDDSVFTQTVSKTPKPLSDDELDEGLGVDEPENKLSHSTEYSLTQPKPIASSSSSWVASIRDLEEEKDAATYFSDRFKKQSTYSSNPLSQSAPVQPGNYLNPNRFKGEDSGRS